jgi:hypothetical protein
MRGIQACMSSPCVRRAVICVNSKSGHPGVGIFVSPADVPAEHDWSICIQLVGNRSRSVNDLNQAHENARRKHRCRVLGLEHKNS